MDPDPCTDKYPGPCVYYCRVKNRILTPVQISTQVPVFIIVELGVDPNPCTDQYPGPCVYYCRVGCGP